MNRPAGLGAALGIEIRKFLSARLPMVTAAMVVVGAAAIASSVVLAAAGGSPDLVAKLGPLAAQGGWAGYLSAATQVTSAGGFLACGVVASWAYGREFTDGTIAGLYALPVRRTTIAGAKLTAYLAWALAASVLLAAALPLVGLVAGFGTLGPAELGALWRLAALTPLTALMAVPAAWIATLTRGPLGGIAATVVLVASAQILVLSGAGEWFPPAVPALWAMAPAATNPAALPIALWWPVLATLLTLGSWRRLQLDH
ncbi:ABC transporter permease [Agromyces sp. H3Y2-19a]|uniref:ABC transporter permease n=1 Tax=Agromyces chromiiresistens TaxID=3030835 RepID=UPI0023BA1AD4|nr:ABC transporter permease [Agromyces chromiiresistens]MDF0515322.1 ABC transporter permease [Agromyces chromiiresistens]